MQIDLQKINEFIRDKKQEDLSLEFKTVNGSDLSHRSDRRNLAKCISGFANSQGGMVIWGIVAKRNRDGIDYAGGKKPISDAKHFHGKLIEFSSSASQPVVDGVEHYPIFLSGDVGPGFAVTKIPQSGSIPHMAKLGEDRYYKRSGDSFYKLEHFDLEDIFGRRRKPILEPIVRAKPVDSGRRLTIDAYIGIRNSGIAVAKYPYMEFRMPDRFQTSMFGVDGNCNEGLPRIRQQPKDGYVAYGGDQNRVIHPGAEIDVCKIHFEDEVTRRIPCEQLVIAVRLAAEDFAMKEFDLEARLEQPRAPG